MGQLWAYCLLIHISHVRWLLVVKEFQLPGQKSCGARRVCVMQVLFIAGSSGAWRPAAARDRPRKPPTHRSVVSTHCDAGPAGRSNGALKRAPGKRKEVEHQMDGGASTSEDPEAPTNVFTPRARSSRRKARQPSPDVWVPSSRHLKAEENGEARRRKGTTDSPASSGKNTPFKIPTKRDRRLAGTLDELVAEAEEPATQHQHQQHQQQQPPLEELNTYGITDPRELKRMKRVLSNRESARRSRLRKEVETDQLKNMCDSKQSEIEGLGRALTAARQLVVKLLNDKRSLVAQVRGLGGHVDEQMLREEAALDISIPGRGDGGWGQSGRDQSA